MSGYVADADFNAPVALQHVVVVAAHFVGGLHETGNIQFRDLMQFFLFGQNHPLQPARDFQFRRHPHVLGFQALVEQGDFLVGGGELGGALDDFLL